IIRDICVFFFFSSRRRHTRFSRDWSSDVCSRRVAIQEMGGPFPEGVACFSTHRCCGCDVDDLRWTGTAQSREITPSLCRNTQASRNLYQNSGEFELGWKGTAAFRKVGMRVDLPHAHGPRLSPYILPLQIGTGQPDDSVAEPLTEGDSGK